MEGGIAEDNTAATKWYLASIVRPAVPNPDTDDERRITSEEESKDERLPNDLVSERTLTYQGTQRKILAPVTVDTTTKDLKAQDCVRSRFAKIQKELLGGGANTVKRYGKTNGTKQWLPASQVVGVVTTQEPIVCLEPVLMSTRILAEYKRDVFSGKVRLCRCQEHPRVCGTEVFGFTKLNLSPNAKPTSVKPIRLVGEHAAAEPERVEDFLARGWIEPCPASECVFNGFIVSKKEIGK